jgi:hypothetical protein
LGAGHKTTPAQYAIVVYDFGLVVFKLDGLNRAMPDALVAGFAVGRF